METKAASAKPDQAQRKATFLAAGPDVRLVLIAGLSTLEATVIFAAARAALLRSDLDSSQADRAAA